MPTIDGNEAAASVAYRLSEVIAIYPITPASPMAQFCDDWSVARRPNLWGAVPDVVEMQSEAGAAGAAHGALQAGALATTFTASQGLLLMIPDMFKIAGELTPFCMHVAARTVATHALSIFGDHSDVMACRGAGFAMLASSSVQEAHDMAAVAHAVTLRSRVPFLHFFDGFRTSHEVASIKVLSDDDLRALVDERDMRAHRARALTPDRPVLRGTAQNPDTFFQAREACNPWYAAVPSTVKAALAEFERRTGRSYRLFEYHGHPEADRAIVIMGSGAETARETVECLAGRGERVGVLQVHLYRPFSVPDFLAALPPTVRSLAVLDHTKEPGAPAEPLHLDVIAAARGSPVRAIIGGRYGLSSKEFTPAMVKAALDELARPQPRDRFTVGIVDDVTGLSLPAPDFDVPAPDTVEAVFYGLASDGTVGANKNTVKIVAQETGRQVQAYFEYDSRKAGTLTVSHLRFGPRPIRSAYRIRRAGFVAVHQFDFLNRYDVLELAAPGATLLLNAAPAEAWDRMLREAQQAILARGLRIFAVDAGRVARECGLGGRINTVMQTAFFRVSGLLPMDRALEVIRESIRSTYGPKGAAVVERNLRAVDRALEGLAEIPRPGRVTATRERPPTVPPDAPEFVRRVTAVMLDMKGDLLPVSAFPPDGTWPVGTSRWEKRNLADEIPVVEPDLCIQCNKCVLMCPHAAIRAKLAAQAALAGAPEGFLSMAARSSEGDGQRYLLQVAPEDCTGCGLCVAVCPAKDKANPERKALRMAPQAPLRDAERRNFEFFLGLPEVDRAAMKIDNRRSQFLQPLFEFSGACSGCGETPYIKLLTQLYGDRLLIANATGCSSIFGGNLPTAPYTTDRNGRGPAWSNSLFEDNAEFGLGMRLALQARESATRERLRRIAPRIGESLAQELLGARPADEAAFPRRRRAVAALREALRGIDDPDARALETEADVFVPRSVWAVGGDGWAYDIGFGGLDHVLSMRHDVNVLVLDTESYSNTGGQQSKATPLGAAARFASAGKATEKKDLGLMAMSYGHVYVARVALGAKDAQAVKAIQEAESYPGPSLVIAYAHCIAHGYDMADGVEQQKRAVECGTWPLYRYDPRRALAGEPPLVIDSPAPKLPVREFQEREQRFRMVKDLDPERYGRLMEESQRAAERRYALYAHLAGFTPPRR